MAAATSRELPPLGLRVCVPDQVLMRQVGEEMVMLDLDREHYYGLDPVGARLMQIAERGATLREIADQLLEEFDAGRDQIEGDVRRLAADLLAGGLLAQDLAK